MLTIQTIEDLASLRRLEAEWNQLLSRSSSDGIFLTWEWISSWWEVYGSGYQLLVLLVRDQSGALRGLAPLMIGKGKGRLDRPLRRLMFIGQDVDVSPEYLDFIIETGLERPVLERVCAWLVGEQRGRWDVLYLERMRSASSSLLQLQAVLLGHGVKLQLGEEIVCFYAELPSSFEAFLASKSNHFRKRWSYTCRRLARDGEVTYRFAPDEVSVEEAFQALYQLNRERFGEAGTSFRTPQYLQMHLAFCRAAAPRGWLVLGLMEQGGQVIAAKYDYLYGGKLWGNQGGWRRELQQKNLGEVFIGKLFEMGIARGLGEYDFLGWAAAYKERWATGRRSMLDHALAYSPGWRGQAARLLSRGKQVLREKLPPELLDSLRRLKRKLSGEPQPEPAAPAEERGEAAVAEVPEVAAPGPAPAGQRKARRPAPVE